jgi:hypothetical protein
LWQDIEEGRGGRLIKWKDTKRRQRIGKQKEI